MPTDTPPIDTDYAAYEVSVPEISDDDIDQLIAAFPVFEASRSAIGEQLRETAYTYCTSKQQLAFTPSIATQNANLKRLRQAISALLSELGHLDPGAEIRILDTARGADPGEVTEVLSNLPVQLDDLQLWIDAALKPDSNQRGPRPTHELRQAVYELVELYEHISGKPATHNPHTKTDYVGTPQSEAGQFIVAAMKLIDPEVTESQISGALGAVLKIRRTKKSGDQLNKKAG